MDIVHSVDFRLVICGVLAARNFGWWQVENGKSDFLYGKQEIADVIFMLNENKGNIEIVAKQHFLFSIPTKQRKGEINFLFPFFLPKSLQPNSI